MFSITCSLESKLFRLKSISTSDDATFDEANVSKISSLSTSPELIKLKNSRDSNKSQGNFFQSNLGIASIRSFFSFPLCFKFATHLPFNDGVTEHEKSSKTGVCCKIAESSLSFNVWKLRTLNAVKLCASFCCKNNSG